MSFEAKILAPKLLYFLLLVIKACNDIMKCVELDDKIWALFRDLG